MKQYNQGLISFCRAKNLHIPTVVNQFCQFHKVEGSRDNYIQQNWNQFATFVDKGLKAGTIKGKDISLAGNTYKEITAEKRNYRDQMKAFSQEQLDFWNLIKKDSPHFSELTRFFSLHGLNIPKKNKDAFTKLGENLPRYEFILRNNLMGELKLFMEKVL